MKQLVISQEPADPQASGQSAESWCRRIYRIDLTALLDDQVVEIREGLVDRPQVKGRLANLCQEVQAACSWYSTVASRDGLVCPTHPYEGLCSADHAVIEILRRYLKEHLEVKDLTRSKHQTA